MQKVVVALKKMELKLNFKHDLDERATLQNTMESI